MRAHIVENGIVVNTIEVESLSFPIGPGKTLIDGAIGGIGWAYSGGKLTAPESEDVPEPTPQAVTPAQGLMALYVLHEITESDISAAIASIEDPAQRYQATIAFTRATVWERASVSMGVVAQLMGLTESDLDAAFTLAATYTNL